MQVPALIETKLERAADMLKLEFPALMNGGAILLDLARRERRPMLAARYGGMGRTLSGPSAMRMPLSASATCMTWRAKSEAGWAPALRGAAIPSEEV